MWSGVCVPESSFCFPLICLHIVPELHNVEEKLHQTVKLAGKILFNIIVIGERGFDLTPLKQKVGEFLSMEWSSGKVLRTLGRKRVDVREKPSVLANWDLSTLGSCPSTETGRQGFVSWWLHLKGMAPRSPGKTFLGCKTGKRLREN